MTARERREGSALHALLLIRLTLLIVILAVSVDAVSAQGSAPVFEVSGFGTTGDEVVEVQVNGLFYADLSFGISTSTESVTLPAGTTWSDVRLFWADGLNGQGVNMDINFLSFTLDGDERTMTAGDVEVSGQWDTAISACTSLGDPIGTTIHCQGVVQFPEDGVDPPVVPDLDPSYWGNAITDVPVYDTAWDLSVSATTEEAATYSEFLSSSGFAGFATTYLGSVHPITHQDPYGNVAATVAGNGNLVLNAAHADRFEDHLDAAHAEGLRVILMVVWERKWIDDYGLITEANAYDWGFQVGARFKDHPAIQTFTLGGDAASDDPREQLWINMADGLVAAGVTDDLSYHTGSSPARRIANLSAAWNTSQMVQTSHCATPEVAKARIEGVVAVANIPVWAGEMRYEGIDPTWCVPTVSVVTGADVLADSLAVIEGGAVALIYGHNDRWQWGHGVLGGGNQGWTTVVDSFDDPGQHLIIEALTPAAPGLTVLGGPCVVYDSVSATATGLDGTMSGDDVRTVQVTGTLSGQGGASSCVPAGASSVVFGISSIDPLTEGNLLMTPAGVTATGSAGVVNYGAESGLNNANTVTIPVSALGAVDIEANTGPAGAVSTTDVRLVAIGYYSPDVDPDLKFFSVNPCAVADSRTTQGASNLFDGPGGDGLWPVGSAFPDIDVVGVFPVGQGGGNGAVGCGVPATADAVMLNVVAVNMEGGSGHLSVGTGDPVDEATTPFAVLTPKMNNGATTIVNLGPGGTIAIDIDGDIAASTMIRVEVLGYYDNDPAGFDFVDVTPCAVFDTRTGQGATGIFAGERLHGPANTTSYQIAGASVPVGQGGIVDTGGGVGTCGVPDSAKAVLINLEAVNAIIEGNFWVSAEGTTTTGGVLNFNNVVPKMNNANAVVVPLSALGQLDLEINAGSFTTPGDPVAHARGVILGYDN